MPNLKGSEWLIIILLIALLFGAKRLPEAARGLGRSLRIFKAEVKGLNDDEPASPSVTPTAATTTAVPPASAPVGDPIVPPTAQLPPATPAPAQTQAPQPPASA